MLRTIHQKQNTDHPHQTDTLPLRPHHGMCLSYFSGKGYSTGFTANMARIKSLLEETDPLVRLTTGMDCICGSNIRWKSLTGISAGDIPVIKFTATAATA